MEHSTVTGHWLARLLLEGFSGICLLTRPRPSPFSGTSPVLLSAHTCSVRKSPPSPGRRIQLTTLSRMEQFAYSSPRLTWGSPVSSHPVRLLPLGRRCLCLPILRTEGRLTRLLLSSYSPTPPW